MSKIRVVHYINQFFPNIGGEENADYPAELRIGEVVGPGLALAQIFGDEAEIVATIVCGDSYFNENLEKAKAEILEMVKGQNADLWHKHLTDPIQNCKGSAKYGKKLHRIHKIILCPDLKADTINNNGLRDIGNESGNNRSDIHSSKSDPLYQHNGYHQIHCSLNKCEVLILFKYTCCRLEIRQHNPFSLKVIVN